MAILLVVNRTFIGKYWDMGQSHLDRTNQFGVRIHRLQQLVSRVCSFFILIFLFIMLFPMRVNSQIVTGAEQMDQYLPLLKGKRVGMVVNHTSVVGAKQTHLLDVLLKRNVQIVKVFAPEHGFRGNADAGETVKDGKDSRTGIPIVSLYGDNKKPSATQLKDVDVILFDIQDVGARFYTYISTMYYVMEACAENKKEMIVLDRPNPCDYVDGPILKPAYRSFVGMLPIPVLHGCTIGELAQMINGEGLRKKGNKKRQIPAMGNWRTKNSHYYAESHGTIMPMQCYTCPEEGQCFF